MAMFQEGGLQVLNTLLKVETEEVVIQACESFAILTEDSMIVFLLHDEYSLYLHRVH
jgi:hypothetical protein